MSITTQVSLNQNQFVSYCCFDSGLRDLDEDLLIPLQFSPGLQLDQLVILALHVFAGALQIIHRPGQATEDMVMGWTGQVIKGNLYNLYTDAHLYI